MGNGCSIQIFGDKWFPMKNNVAGAFAPSFSEGPTFVSSLIDRDVGEWQIDMLEDLFDRDIVEASYPSH